MRVRRAAAALVALVALLVVAPASGAQAHAFLVGSNPADGELLTAAPTVLRLDFSESVVLDATRISVVDGEGHQVSPTGLRLVTPDPSDREAPVQVEAMLPELAHGTYRVSWQTLSSDDQHRASGVLAFGIGERVVAAGSIDEAPGVGEALGRWVLWSALAGVLGPLVISALARSSLAGRRRDRLAVLARASAAALLVASVALPAAQLRSVRQAWLAAQTPSVGGVWALRAVAAAVALVLAARVVRRLSAPRAAGLSPIDRVEIAVLATALLAVPAATGLRGHIWSSSRPLVAVDVLHMVAAATWVGAVVALAVAHAGGAGPRPVVRAKAFALLSASCVAVAVASGFLLAGHGVTTTTALQHARYGVTLLVKGALVAVVLLLALRNHRRGRTDGATGLQGRRTVTTEAVLLIGVLAAAGVLAATSPANSPQWTPEPAASRSVALRADDLLVQLAIGPNAVGPAYANVSVLQTRRPAPAPVRSVQVVLRHNGSAPVGGAAVAQPDGTWALPLQLPESGQWRLSVTAERPGLPVAVASGVWVVPGGLHGPAGRDLSDLTTPAALLVVLVWLVALIVVATRTRGRTARPAPFDLRPRSSWTRRPNRPPRPSPHPSWLRRTSPEAVSPHGPGSPDSPGAHRRDTRGVGGTDPGDARSGASVRA